MQVSRRELPLIRFQHSENEKFRNCYQHRIVFVGASRVLVIFVAACRTHICLESFINTIKLHVVRQKVWLKSNSQSFYAKFDCSWNANTRICSVEAIHITRSIVVYIICMSNIKRHSSQGMVWKRIPIITSMSSPITCRFLARNMDIKGEEAVISPKLHDKPSTNSSTFCG
jgi:hypothetical protein